MAGIQPGSETAKGLRQKANLKNRHLPDAAHRKNCAVQVGDGREVKRMRHRDLRVVNGGKASIKILQDAFSRSSSFKKAALFEGSNSSLSFWSCHVIDKQAASSYGTAAEYWVDHFLDSKPSLTGKAGTRMFAECLKRTHEALVEQVDKDILSTSIVAIRASQTPKWTINKFAKEFLPEEIRQQFIDSAPPEARATSFVLDKQEFDKKLNFRVFRLEIRIFAPFSVNSTDRSDTAAQ